MWLPCGCIQVDYQLRYQGSDIHVMPTRAWEKSPHTPKDSDRMPMAHAPHHPGFTHHPIIAKVHTQTRTQIH